MMTNGSLSALALALSLGLVTPVEAQDWTGPYLSFGLSSTQTDLRSRTEDEASPGTGTQDLAPYLAAGYDWEVGNLTFGLLFDIQELEAEDNMLSSGKGSIAEADLFATLRGRVGVPMGDQMRLYASAGVAWLDTTVTVLDVMGTPPESRRQNGSVVGLAMDYLLAPGRTLTFEYLHADFGTDTYLEGGLQLSPTVDAVRVGLTLRF